ncbi:hypothetical protein, conserved [Eimeria necatrix]|uniref:Uncharacterized protein n=1 Tax=Eimeria necatrix TaxID=51315 RepID=U6N6M9_9EIME|nr:hypothetical protein, conserved [Eimeria necatrix]CDJ70355.1 hypothetical protein, conserved [Eimeria necatrix]
MQKCLRATGGEAAAAAADLGNSSLSSEPSREKAATGPSRWKHLFCSGSKTGSNVEQQQQQPQQQPQQQHAEALPPSTSDSKTGLTRRLLWHQRKHHSCPTAAPAAALAAASADSAAAGGEAAAAGSASGAAQNGRAAPAAAAAAAAAANSLNPRHSTCPPLIRGRSVRFGPAEVREFLPDTESGNPSRDSTQVGHSVEKESEVNSEVKDLEAAEEWRAILEPVHRSSSGLLVSDTLGVSAADNEAEQEPQSASEDDEVGGVLSILRRDIAAAAAAAALTAADGAAAAAAQEETTQTPDAVEEDLEGGRYVCASRLFSF